jgi:pSer/pThr/pTyr-binding forkhead associated (FHA) protein
MQVVLVMFRGEGERRSFSIVHDVTVIGRREDCDFRIPLGEISRKHCRLIKDGDTLRAEDLGSSNGTFVNGARVQEAELSPGDTLKVGSVLFVVQIDGVPAEPDIQPVVSPPPAEAAAEEDHLHATTQAEPPYEDDMAAQAGDEPTVDEESAHHMEPMREPTGEPVAAGGTDEYDPMSILEADPDASSVGSMMDDDHIAEDLIVELEQQDHTHPNQ